MLVQTSPEIISPSPLASFLSLVLPFPPDLLPRQLERYLHAGRSAVATVFAPISFPPLPLLGFKESSTGVEDRMEEGAGAEGGAAPAGGAKLALTGSLRGPAPERVIVKRVVLTGFPLRVHKKRATVRFMFHSADDVRWFAPLELWTACGRRGRITEPLGTHGHMKCVFDGVIQQRDSVCVSLYKRVYPPWPEPVSRSEELPSLGPIDIGRARAGSGATRAKGLLPPVTILAFFPFSFPPSPPQFAFGAPPLTAKR